MENNIYDMTLSEGRREGGNPQVSREEEVAETGKENLVESSKAHI